LLRKVRVAAITSATATETIRDLVVKLMGVLLCRGLLHGSCQPGSLWARRAVGSDS
jgi:hypothetical protein